MLTASSIGETLFPMDSKPSSMARAGPAYPHGKTRDDEDLQDGEARHAALCGEALCPRFFQLHEGLGEGIHGLSEVHLVEIDTFSG